MTQYGSCTRIYNNSKLNSAYQNVKNFPKSYSNSYDNSIFSGYSSNNNSGMSGFETAALIFSGLAIFATPIISLLGLFKNNNADNKNDKNVSNNNAQTPETETVKSPADDLLQAISDCRNNGKVEELKTKVNADKISQEAQVATIADMTKTAETTYKTENDLLSGLNDSYKTAEGTLSKLEKSESEAETAATTADKAFESAQKSYGSAEKSLANAQAAVNAATTPEANAELEDTVLKAAKDDLEVAKINLNSAEKKQTETNNKKAEAQKARAEQEKTVKEQAAKIKVQKEKVDTAKKTLDTAKASQAKAQAVNDKWAKNIQEAQAELSKYSNSEADQEKTETIASVNQKFNNGKPQDDSAESEPFGADYNKRYKNYEAKKINANTFNLVSHSNNMIK